MRGLREWRVYSGRESFFTIVVKRKEARSGVDRATRRKNVRHDRVGGHPLHRYILCPAYCPTPFPVCTPARTLCVPPVTTYPMPTRRATVASGWKMLPGQRKHTARGILAPG